jgi:hypothetical protein
VPEAVTVPSEALPVRTNMTLVAPVFLMRSVRLSLPMATVAEPAAGEKVAELP